MPPPTHRPASLSGSGRARVFGVRSIGVAWRRRRFERFLDEEIALQFLPPGVPAIGVEGLAGWGRKGSAGREAARLGLPYLALEDGFLRTAGLGGRHDPSLSLTADLTGVHYDASRPSDLEALIGQWETFGAAELEDADRLMALMRQENLGKFNGSPDAPGDDPLLADSPVAVVDQIARDKSIAGGGCGAQTFAAMLDAAVAENPGKRVIARVHPFDGVGGRRGHLKPLAEARGVPVYDADVSWMSVARRTSRVYVATSHAGLEALIAGVPVTCFGLPAYAGWALTDDRQACPRRAARPSLEAVVAAIYLRYSRYLSPLDGEPCPALEIARLLAARRRRDRETEGLTHVLGVHPWKQVQAAPFVKGARSKVTWTMHPANALLRQRREGGRIVTWASREPDDFAAACASQGAPVVRMEDGFLRSVGLGANLELPSSLVLDHAGVYYDPSAASDLELILATHPFPEELTTRAAALRHAIVEARLSKYNVGSTDSPSAFSQAGTRTRVLVPGQVTTDASVLRGGGTVRDNLALLRAVRQARPDAFIVYKPHPDVEAGIREGAVARERILAVADAIAERAAIAPLLDQADELHTLTSLAGFEALLRGKYVATYGLPFYAGWGITVDLERCPRRIRRLGVDELVAGALLIYPRYVHRPSGWPCEAEDIVAQLARSVGDSDGADLINRRRTKTLLSQLRRRWR